MGYFILKLYSDGNWKEIVIDDYIPCLKDQPLLSTNFKGDIGWLILQKAIAKVKGSYFFENSNQMITKEFIKLLTGLPIKTISCSKKEKCLKAMNKYSENKVKLLHFKEEYAEKYGIQPNLPYILKDCIRVNDKNGIFIIKNLEGELKIPDTLDLTTINRDYFDFIKSQIDSEDSHSSFIEANIFKELFSEMHILLGTENYLQNTAKFTIFCEQNDDFSQLDVFSFHKNMKFSNNLIYRNSHSNLNLLLRAKF